MIADCWTVWQGPKGRHVDGPDFPWMKRTRVVSVERLAYVRALAGVCGDHPSCHSHPCIHSALDALIEPRRNEASS